MTDVVKTDEPFAPVAIGLLGPSAAVTRSQRPTQSIHQYRRLAGRGRGSLIRWLAVGPYCTECPRLACRYGCSHGFAPFGKTAVAGNRSVFLRLSVERARILGAHKSTIAINSMFLSEWCQSTNGKDGEIVGMRKPSGRALLQRFPLYAKAFLKGPYCQIPGCLGCVSLCLPLWQRRVSSVYFADSRH